MEIYGLKEDPSLAGSKIVQVTLSPCDPDNPPESGECASHEEIVTYMQTKVLELYIKTSFVDFEDYDMPIKSQLVLALRKSIQIEQSISSFVKLQRNQFID